MSCLYFLWWMNGHLFCDIWNKNVCKLFLITSHILSTWSSLSPHLQILDKLLDRESQTHKPQTLSSFYSSKPAAGCQRSPSKHTSASHSGVGGTTGVVSKHGSSSSPAATLAASSSTSSPAVVLAGDDVVVQPELNPVSNSIAGESSAETREHGENSHPSLNILRVMNNIFTFTTMLWDLIYCHCKALGFSRLHENVYIIIEMGRYFTHIFCRN